jgi:ABC-type phosphate/phosphonate transport system substrate-binding protein
MDQSLALLVPESTLLRGGAVRALRTTIADETGLAVTLVVLPSAALLGQVLDQLPNAIAWAPSLVAADLRRMGQGSPLATVSSGDGARHQAVLVARRGIEGLAELAGFRVGWVSRLSVTGYRLPRLYLESFGVDLGTLFAREVHCGTHEAVASALELGNVDVIATHSGRLRSVLGPRTRLLASIGPIPSDVLVAGEQVPAKVRARLATVLPSTRAADLRLSPVRDAHFALFDQLHQDRFGTFGRAPSARQPTEAEVVLH